MKQLLVVAGSLVALGAGSALAAEGKADAKQVERGRYLAPTAPGASTEMLQESVDAYTWRGAHAEVTA